MTAFQFDLLHTLRMDALQDGSIVAGVSSGNDSVALVQLLHERGHRDVVCLEGVLRSKTPEWIEDSPLHGGPRLWQPLFDKSDVERDALILRDGHEPLNHKSKECKVCVSENRQGLIQTPEVAIADIERIENALGFSSTGKPKTMFRPAHKMGATGIRQIVRWARSKRGKFSLDDGTGPSATDTGCDGGFCAS